jgi:hypothetical protein
MQRAKSPGVTLRRSLRRQSPGEHPVAPGHGSQNKCGLPRRRGNGAEGRGWPRVADASLNELGALPAQA